MSNRDSKFAHRENRDGTFDSICRECFATVATTRHEPDLAKAERAHTCGPRDLARFTQLREK